MTTSQSGEATLHGYGRIPWTALHRALVAQATDASPVDAAWADYDGFHVGDPPADPPPYTHLWAWTPEWRLRARIDHEHAIVGVLQLGPALPATLHQLRPATAPSPSRVMYTKTTGRTWPSDEKRVGPIPPYLADRAVELHQLDGTHPVTFIGLT
ncbi:MAG: hypothetical protein QOE61_1410 [Micromonosporaceae bacterium]|nr:hypothetical protein [Micromonosporaceae bacterium]